MLGRLLSLRIIALALALCLVRHRHLFFIARPGLFEF